MAGCADNEQLNLKLFGKFDDVSHRMPGESPPTLTKTSDK
jgi:hypothetical protein